MPALRSSRISSTIACACVLAVGCGDDKPPSEQAAVAEQKFDPPPPTPLVEREMPLEPVEDWSDMPSLDDEDTDADEDPPGTGAEAETGEAGPTEPWPGPCAIRWSSGTQVRFAYDDDRSKGTVRIDLDGDGKSDVCGRFELADGRTTKVEVDEGCNRTFDLRIEPEYDAKANLATARYTTGGETKPITLVTMPSFGGLDPGYPLQAARKDVELKIAGGLVRSARVKAPHAGPPVRLTLSYDRNGRLTRLDEDQNEDGTIDRRFNYTYDALGNVTRITFRFGEGDDERKGNARLDYRCWTAP
jgi:YD repeat-containing protein